MKHFPGPARETLRSSRQTELEQAYPTYVVCKWLGNTPNVAHKHYLTVTEEHYKKAAENGGQTGDADARNASPGRA